MKTKSSKGSTKHGTTNKRLFQKREKMESSKEDWEKEFDNIWEHCACIAPDDASQKELIKRLVRGLLTLKEKEVAKATIKWVTDNSILGRSTPFSDLEEFIDIKRLIKFLNKEYKLKEKGGKE